MNLFLFFPTERDLEHDMKRRPNVAKENDVKIAPTSQTQIDDDRVKDVDVETGVKAKLEDGDDCDHMLSPNQDV